MFRSLIVTAAIAASGTAFAPTALAVQPQAGAALSGPRLVFGVDLPISPVSQQNAVRAAEDYLSVMPFSRQGLIQQLVSIDRYSTADATFAVDSITVDWNEQAVKSATDYLNVMPFSRQGLIEQLISIDGFTRSQAAYGVAATGL